MRPILAGLVALLALAAPASAALPPAGSGSIVIDPANSDLHFGGYVDFIGTYPGNRPGDSKQDRLSNPRVQLLCYQSDELVYGEAGGTAHVFSLGGSSSQWIANGGGAADCHADLFYFKKVGSDKEWSGHGDQEVVFLASVDFSVSG